MNWTRFALVALIVGGLMPTALIAQPDAPKTQPAAPKTKATSKAKKAQPKTSPPAAAAPADEDPDKNQGSNDEGSGKAAPAADPNKPAAAEYAQVFEEWKTLLKDLRKLKAEYQNADDAGQKSVIDRWNALVVTGNELLARLELAGIKAYEESPNEDPQLLRFLVKVAADHVAHDRYEPAYAIAEPLAAHESPEKQIIDSAGAAAFVLNDFDKAAEYFEQAQEAGVLSKYSQELAPHVEDYKKLWADEQKIREAEAAKDDLPRVKLSTSKGDIVLELFENEAPETVGNFISLVEKKDDAGKGYFEGVPFHRVLANFMAQGGDPTGTGSGGPGYQFEDEANDHKVVRGALAMANAGPNTNGSQFFIVTTEAAPWLDGKHTVFGRVTSGMGVVDAISAVQTGPGDRPREDIVMERVELGS